MIILTSPQADTLEFIREFIKKNRYAPSITDIADEFDIYPNAAQNRIRLLRLAGAVTREGSKARSLSVVKGFRYRRKDAV